MVSLQSNRFSIPTHHTQAPVGYPLVSQAAPKFASNLSTADHFLALNKRLKSLKPGKNVLPQGIISKTDDTQANRAEIYKVKKITKGPAKNDPVSETSYVFLYLRTEVPAEKKGTTSQHLFHLLQAPEEVDIPALTPSEGTPLSKTVQDWLAQVRQISGKEGIEISYSQTGDDKLLSFNKPVGIATYDDPNTRRFEMPKAQEAKRFFFELLQKSRKLEINDLRL